MINLTLENSFITKFKHLLKNLSFLLFGRLDSIPEKSIKEVLIYFFKLLTYDKLKNSCKIIFFKLFAYGLEKGVHNFSYCF